MSKEIDLGWDNHEWVNQEELAVRVTKEWHTINNTCFNGAYDIDKRLSVEDLKTFLWAAYNYCVTTYYDNAGVEIGSKLKRPDYLHITKYKTSYAGRCRSFGPVKKDGTFSIAISYKYYEDWGSVQILETLYHEIGHLSYWEHNDEFWAEGERIGYGLAPKGVLPRPAKFERYCEECGFATHSVSRPSKWYVCPACWPYNEAVIPNFNTWLGLASVDKKWMKIRKYTGPEILLY
jgi:hypothetical protein